MLANKLLWSIEGTLQELQPSYVVLKVSGFCFQVFIPASLFLEMPAVGEKLHLFTYLRIREDEAILYGFQDRQEREVFETILGVSKIGPKTALNLLGHLPLPQLYRAIKEGDKHLLATIPGVGKKTAERLIYELKDKVSNWQPLEEPLPVSSREGVQPGNWHDIEQALQGLGYSPQEIARVRKLLRKEETMTMTMEELLKKVLSLLADY